MIAYFRQLIRLESFLIELPQQYSVGESRTIEYIINQSIVPNILIAGELFPPNKDGNFVDEKVFISQDFSEFGFGNRDWIIVHNGELLFRDGQLSEITALIFDMVMDLRNYYSEYREAKVIKREMFGLDISFYYDVDEDDILVEINRNKTL
jgi:hypothetical protein